MSWDIVRTALPEERKATEYLANERTFLAWIRTSIAVRFYLATRSSEVHITLSGPAEWISISAPEI
jgi:uncharacterized membrane protein YidH (DUF202 family)